VGLLQKGDPADFIVVDSLVGFNILKTVINGNIVYDNGEVKIDSQQVIPVNKFNRNPISVKDIEVFSTKINAKIRVIEAIDGDLFTGMLLCTPKIENGKIVIDRPNDILKIVVVNRYDPTSKPTVGFIKNFGLKTGAMASSVAHDSHNIVAVGATDEDLVNAINKVIENQGGLAVCDGSECLDLKLEIAGLMTSSSGEIVASQYELLDKKAKELGSQLKAPFMTLSFMPLLVIPRFKIGDKFLFDGDSFSPVSLEAVE
jgi:adenine deaminase